ncbi:hypothetical protein D3C71_1492980 [compost metagenome]
MQIGLIDTGPHNQLLMMPVDQPPGSRSNGKREVLSLTRYGVDQDEAAGFSHRVVGEHEFLSAIDRVNEHFRREDIKIAAGLPRMAIQLLIHNKPAFH